MRVNFTDIEDYEPLPRGKYHFAVTDGEVKETSDSSKHPGTDFWSLECTVQDGEKQGQTQYLAVMLPPYEVFTLYSLLRATVGQHEWDEEQLKAGDIDVELDDLIGLEFVATVKPQKNNPEYNEMRRISPYDAESWGGADADLLP